MNKAGLTLIEILVVTTIISLLMALMLPSLRSSKHQAKAVLCGSNINQLVDGLFFYEAEHETFPYAFDISILDPPPGGYLGCSSYDRIGWWWFNYITNYLGKDYPTGSIMWCPARYTNNRRLRDNILCVNYGVNLSICRMSHGRKSHAEFIGRSLCSSNIPHPGQTLLVVDSGYAMINWWHATDTPPVTLGNTTLEDTAYIPGLWINKERELWSGQEWDATNGRHPNKTVNVGFADGHVSRMKANNLLVERTSNGYQNLRPLWVPK